MEIGAFNSYFVNNSNTSQNCRVSNGENPSDANRVAFSGLLKRAVGNSKEEKKEENIVFYDKTLPRDVYPVTASSLVSDNDEREAYEHSLGRRSQMREAYRHAMEEKNEREE